ncbi:MAG: isochorismate synthase [Bacteroidales bacterium]|nr:isochorismate synthase [Bacteroidales bacterium]
MPQSLHPDISSVIEACIQDQMPFVAYQMPGENVTQILHGASLIHVENKTHGALARMSGFLIWPFHWRGVARPFLLQDPQVIRRPSDPAPTPLAEFTNDAKPVPPDDHAALEYMQGVSKLIDLIRWGTFRKAVLSRIYSKDKPAGFDPVSFFAALAGAYHHAFTYILHLPGQGIWIGASPELLAGIRGHVFTTMALAGTRKITGNGKESDWTEKECDEQRIVAEEIEDLLFGHGILNYERSVPEDFIAGNIAHLCTRYQFTFKRFTGSIFSLIMSLHPTAAVCGWPRPEALAAILQTERHDREYYTGFLGTLNMEEGTRLFVNIRCMKLTSRKISLFAGAGITASSEPESEWQETELKISTLMNVIRKMTTFGP